MRVTAEDQIRTGVNACPGQINLVGVGLIVELLSPVKAADDVIGVRPHHLDGGTGFVPAWLETVIGTINAKFQAVRCCDDLALILLAVGDAVFLKRCVGCQQPGLTKVQRVVVRRGDKIHAALGQNLRICRWCTEVEGLIGIHLLVSQGALKVRNGIFIIQKVFCRILERIAVVPVHSAVIRELRLVAEILMRCQRLIADDRDGEQLRRWLRCRGRCRFWRRSRRFRCFRRNCRWNIRRNRRRALDS